MKMVAVVSLSFFSSLGISLLLFEQAPIYKFAFSTNTADVTSCTIVRLIFSLVGGSGT